MTMHKRTMIVYIMSFITFVILLPWLSIKVFCQSSSLQLFSNDTLEINSIIDSIEAISEDSIWILYNVKLGNKLRQLEGAKTLAEKGFIIVA